MQELAGAIGAATVNIDEPYDPRLDHDPRYGFGDARHLVEARYDDANACPAPLGYGRFGIRHR